MLPSLTVLIDVYVQQYICACPPDGLISTVSCSGDET